MPMGLSDLTGRLQYKARIESVTRNAVDDFRNNGAWAMVDGLLRRFGTNNRRLIGR